MKRILFTGGGSAGHVIPNLAIMRELRFTHSLSYMGTSGIEKKLVSEAGYPFYTVECPKLVRSLSLNNLTIPIRLHRAKREALALMQEHRPDLVFSKGGFASYPAVWAAAKLKIPVLTHESDLSPGLCTRMIAKKCMYVLTSFPETAKKFPNGRCVGSPIRREILCSDKQRARHKLGLPEKYPVLLVFGGGSGSRALNSALESALPALLATFSVLHITGKENSSLTAPQNTLGTYVALPFLSDMGSAYAAADVIVCRAGSNTVFEVLTLKKSAILVPLQHGSRGDQLENARYFEKNGLVKVLPESDLQNLTETVNNTYADESLKKNISEAHIASGTGEIVKIIKACIEGKDQAGGASE